MNSHQYFPSKKRERERKRMKEFRFLCIFFCGIDLSLWVCSKQSSTLQFLSVNNFCFECFVFFHQNNVPQSHNWIAKPIKNIKTFTQKLNACFFYSYKVSHMFFSYTRNFPSDSLVKKDMVTFITDSWKEKKKKEKVEEFLKERKTEEETKI